VWDGGVCLTRKGLTKAVVEVTRMPGGEARTALYVEAVRRWNEHVCERVPVGEVRKGEPTLSATNPNAERSAPTPAGRPLLASIMADVATLVALGRRATMPDSIAEYDAAYHALERKIARALPKSFTERLEETR